MTKYFCTAGRGTECFVVTELDAIPEVTNTKQTDGKIYFTADDTAIPTLLNLKCVERLFIEAKVITDFHLRSNKDIQELGIALANSADWTHVRNIYQTFWESGNDLPSDAADEIPPKKRKVGEPNLEPVGEGITFRVSCRLAGSLARRFDHQVVSKSLGWHLRQKLGWNVHMRNPFIEICVHIGCVGVTVGIPVTRKPLSLRPYVTDFGLRSTVAWILAKLANIKPGNVVLDPMCGAATILLEATNTWPDAYYIGVDSNVEQLQRAEKNLLKIHGEHINLICGDALRLPIRTDSVDAVVCDMPFGSKYLTLQKVEEMIPDLLKEFIRVLKRRRTLVLLTSSRLKDKLLAQASQMTSPQGKDKEPCSSCPLESVPSSKSSSNQQDSGVRVGESREGGDSLNTCEQHLTIKEPLLQLKETHYLKLGETHAFACVFVKYNL